VNFISICSGIEAASVAFGPLGWKAIAFSEIEPFPCAVLEHHYPNVPNLGDMSRFREWPQEIFANTDAIVGGPPCQAFSVAGARNGLNDDRGNLTLIYAELINHADEIRIRHGKPPVVVLYENVLGLLSDKTGAFGCFLGALAGEDCELKPPRGGWTNSGCVFGPQRTAAWRTLDAQFFQLAQRRRRVFVVASARDDLDPTEILFEFDGMRRDFAPSREAGKVASTIPARSTGGGGLGTDFDCDGGVITMDHGQGGAEIGFDRGPTLTCNHEAPIAAHGIRTANTSSNGWGIQEEITHGLDGAMGIAVAHSLRGEGFDVGEDGTGRGTPLVPVAQPYTLAFHGSQDPDVSGDVTHPVGRNQGQETCVAVQASQSGVRINETIGTLDANYGSRRHNGVMQAMQVRRLTPMECERLQGFPDNYTAIPWRKKPASECPDGPRYKALGNSWAVPVVAWIGKRIDEACANAAPALVHKICA